MTVDFLIVGQGIAGTLLSYELMAAGKKVLVIDNGNKHRSSLVAGAVINPMAGKQWTPSKDADLFISCAVSTYHKLEALINSSVLTATELYIFHETDAGKAAFAEKQKKFPEFITVDENNTGQETSFSIPFGSGKISGLWLVDASLLLEQWKIYLQKNQAYLEDTFDQAALKVGKEEVVYEDVTAGKIIFCEGATAAQNPLFKQLPFTQNRGEALLLDIPDLPQQYVYHKKLRLVPKGNGQFWCGSNYKWNFTDLLPDEDWKEDAIKELQSWLKIPFTIKEHIVAQRPTTAGQIPLIGIHPQQECVGIFNGLGTRGFSAGPYWAHAFAGLLCGSARKMPDYDQARFQKFFG